MASLTAILVVRLCCSSVAMHAVVVGLGMPWGLEGVYDPDPGPDPVHNELELVGAVPKLEKEICRFPSCLQG